MHALTPARTFGGTTRALALAAALLLFVLALLVPAPAHASVKNALTSVTVTPNARIALYDQVTISATWAAPDDAAPGDTFELRLPDYLTGLSDTFNLTNRGTEVGDCRVGATALECTFGDYLLTHAKVNGTLHFTAQATAPTAETRWVWNQGSDHPLTSTVEGGVSERAEQAPPASSDLWSWRALDGSIRWTLLLRGDEIVTNHGHGHGLKLTAAYDHRLSLDWPTFDVKVTSDAGYRQGVWGALPASAYTVHELGYGFTITIHHPDPTAFYRVAYNTPTPGGTVQGDTFTTTVRAADRDFIHSTYEARTAGGDGSGTQKSGTISWTRVGPDATPLAGSSWKVTSASGTEIAVTDNGENDADPAKGALKVTSLPWGTYTLTETKAPTGYRPTPGARTATLDGTRPSASFGEIESAESAGVLSWRKLDAASKPLAGSEWLVTGPDGSQAVIVDNAENDKDPAVGRLKITGLAWGRYTLKETKAPAGYQPSPRPLTALVGADSLAGTFDDLLATPTLSSISPAASP
jgi:hypothetical protein